jgi:hypothetical protein
MPDGKRRRVTLSARDAANVFSHAQAPGIIKRVAIEHGAIAGSVVYKGNSLATYHTEAAERLFLDQLRRNPARPKAQGSDPVKLSSGRTIRHHRMLNGAMEAIPTTGPEAMTNAEWEEYTAIVRARATVRGKPRRNPAERGLLAAIRPGDRVTIVDRFGKERTGRATIIVPGSHVVLNMGGAHGTPAIADDRNITRVVPSKKGGAGFVFRNPTTRGGLFTPTQLVALRREFARISTVQPGRLADFHRIFAKLGNPALVQISEARIKFLSPLAVNEARRRGLRDAPAINPARRARKASAPAKRNPAPLILIEAKRHAWDQWRPAAASHDATIARVIGEALQARGYWVRGSK